MTSDNVSRAGRLIALMDAGELEATEQAIVARKLAPESQDKPQELERPAKPKATATTKTAKGKRA